MAAAPAVADVLADARPSPRQFALLKAIDAASGQNDCGTVLRIGEPITDGVSEADLPAAVRFAIAELVVDCEVDANDNARAYAHVLAWTKRPESSDAFWRMRLLDELRNDRFEAAVATIEAMHEGRGSALNSVSLKWIWPLSRRLKEPSRELLYRRFLYALAADDYEPDEIFGPIDAFKIALAKLFITAKDIEGGRRMLAHVRNPIELQSLQIDVATRHLLPARVDVRKAAEATLEFDKRAVQNHPDRLSPLLNAAFDLRLLGRPQESLDLLQSVSSKIATPDAFGDSRSRLSWYWDAVAKGERMLGHYDKASDAFRRGAAITEDGSPNVSQVINLASMQISFGHPEDALDTIKVLDDASRSRSPFGELQIRLVRACAKAAQGKAKEVSAEMTFAREHRKDAPSVLTGMALCSGQDELVAASIIERLDDPEQRGDALLWFSDYDKPLFKEPRNISTRTFERVFGRRDVKAAIKRAGGIMRFALQGNYD